MSLPLGDLPFIMTANVQEHLLLQRVLATPWPWLQAVGYPPPSWMAAMPAAVAGLRKPPPAMALPPFPLNLCLLQL